MAPDIDDLNEKVNGIALDVAAIKSQLQYRPLADPVKCASHAGSIERHETRLDDIEELLDSVDIKQMCEDIKALKVSAGKENTLRIAMGAIGVGLFFAAKYIWAALQKLMESGS